MVSSKDSSVIIQTSSQSIFSTPSWFGEVAGITQYLRHVGVLTTVEALRTVFLEDLVARRVGSGTVFPLHFTGDANP